MAWTSNDVSLLEDAIATAAIRGYAEVRFSDQQMRRYTLKELMDLRAVMKDATAASSGRTLCTFGSFSKG